MYTVRFFYGPKFLSEEVFKARDLWHAQTLAAYVATCVARDMIPAWMFNEALVSWVVL